jgi:hypothetical protein
LNTIDNDEKREFIVRVVKEMLDTDPAKRPTADEIRNRFTHMRVTPVQLVSLPSNVTPGAGRTPKSGETDKASAKTMSDPVTLATRHVQPTITNESALIRDFVHHVTDFRILKYTVKFVIFVLLCMFALGVLNILLATNSVKSSEYVLTIISGLIVTGVLGVFRGATDHEIGRMYLRRLLVCVCIAGIIGFRSGNWDIIHWVVCSTASRDILLTIS